MTDAAVKGRQQGGTGRGEVRRGVLGQLTPRIKYETNSKEEKEEDDEEDEDEDDEEI